LYFKEDILMQDATMKYCYKMSRKEDIVFSYKKHIFFF